MATPTSPPTTEVVFTDNGAYFDAVSKFINVGEPSLRSPDLKVPYRLDGSSAPASAPSATLVFDGAACCLTGGYWRDEATGHTYNLLHVPQYSYPCGGFKTNWTVEMIRESMLFLPLICSTEKVEGHFGGVLVAGGCYFPLTFDDDQRIVGVNGYLIDQYAAAHPTLGELGIITIGAGNSQLGYAATFQFFFPYFGGAKQMTPSKHPHVLLDIASGASDEQLVSPVARCLINTPATTDPSLSWSYNIHTGLSLVRLDDFEGHDPAELSSFSGTGFYFPLLFQGVATTLKGDDADAAVAVMVPYFKEWVSAMLERIGSPDDLIDQVITPAKAKSIPFRFTAPEYPLFERALRGRSVTTAELDETVSNLGLTKPVSASGAGSAPAFESDPGDSSATPGGSAPPLRPAFEVSTTAAESASVPSLVESLTAGRPFADLPAVSALTKGLDADTAHAIEVLSESNPAVVLAAYFSSIGAGKSAADVLTTAMRTLASLSGTSLSPARTSVSHPFLYGDTLRRIRFVSDLPLGSVVAEALAYQFLTVANTDIAEPEYVPTDFVFPTTYVAFTRGLDTVKTDKSVMDFMNALNSLAP